MGSLQNDPPHPDPSKHFKIALLYNLPCLIPKTFSLDNNLLLLSLFQMRVGISEPFRLFKQYYINLNINRSYYLGVIILKEKTYGNTDYTLP